MSERDTTFDDASAYGSTLWVARTLGRSRNWLIEKRDTMVKTEGFPRPDAVTGHYIKEDVLAWVRRRRQIADRVEVSATHHQPARINDDDL